MARNTIYVEAPPDAVFEVLADPRFLANWSSARAGPAAWKADGPKWAR